jgi:2-polyprenyl-3-methyl-5-hydroxy-6-metoxy-1,4-benzoquinol methylase
VKYYFREHIAGYERMKREGKRSWHETQGGGAYDDFASRPFLEAALPRLSFASAHPTALEIGCGTGVATCFLAERGFRVDAIDLIPTAIEVAREVAAERGLDISYRVGDICELPREGKLYDLIVDSFCLQAIVLDEDRARVLGNVRARLKPEGYYVVSTAMFDASRFRRDDTITDEQTGIMYNRYGEDGIIEQQTGIAYIGLDGSPGPYDGAINVGERWYLPSRRHLKPVALKAELTAAGFRVLLQVGEYGENAICVHAESGQSLR